MPTTHLRSDQEIRDGVVNRCKQPKAPLATAAQALNAWNYHVRYTSDMHKAEIKYFQAGKENKSKWEHFHNVRHKAYKRVVRQWERAIKAYMERTAQGKALAHD